MQSEDEIASGVLQGCILMPLFNVNEVLFDVSINIGLDIVWETTHLQVL